MITQIKCPRCGQIGNVEADRRWPEYVVVSWANGSKDTCVRADVATRGDFGCGHDDDRDCRACKHNTRDGNAGLTPGCYAKLDVRWPACWEAKR